MSRAASFKQADVERAVRGAVRGAGMQPGTYTIKVAPDGGVMVLPFRSSAVQLADDPDAELKAWLAENGDG